MRGVCVEFNLICFVISLLFVILCLLDSAIAKLG